MSGATPPEGLRTLSSPSPDAARIVLVRHGQGVVNVSGVIGGPIGCVGLTDLGRAQVAALAEHLRATGDLDDATAVYASVLPRAIETAGIVASAIGLTPAEVIEDCGLCELHPGEADGLVWERYVETFDVPDWDVDPSQLLAPGGESWNGFVDRVGDALESLADRHRGQRVVVGTHAGVIESSMLRFMRGEPAGSDHSRLRLRTKHASITEWERTDKGWLLLRYNDAVEP